MLNLQSPMTPQRPGRRSLLMRGVTLIELMVGLLLGLVVVLVTAQVLSFAEGQKRLTTGGADAQVNGALAGAPAANFPLFPTGNSLADQLKIVARMISVSQELGAKRQVGPRSGDRRTW